MTSVCVAEDGPRGRVTTAGCIQAARPMEIVSSISDSEADENKDRDNQPKPKPAAITSRQSKRAPKSPILDTSSVVSIKEKLKSIMDNLGAAGGDLWTNYSSATAVCGCQRRAHTEEEEPYCH